MTLLSLAAAFALGAALALRYEVSAAALGLLLLASLFAVALLLSWRRSLLPALILVVIVLGMLRVEGVGDPTSELAVYHTPNPLGIDGVVVSDPEAAGAASRFRLRVDRIGAPAEPEEVSGEVLVTVRESAELARQRDRPYFRYGDRLLLEGVLEAPPELEGFDYPAYLARQGIGSVMSFPEATFLGEGEGAAFYRWLYGVRRSIADSLARTVPEPQASLGQALLLGMRDNLPEDLVEEFRVTGTSHVLAISGLHVAILLGISLAVSRGVFGARRQLYLVLPFALMWLYALISGMSPSVIRASIMGSVVLAVLLLGRPRSVLPALGFAAAVMVAVSPNVVERVSFQLSFAAMAGIALMAEPLRGWIQRAHRPLSGSSTTSLSQALSAVSVVLAVTVAATLATLPLVAFYFERVSMVGIPTTILALPALPAVLVLQAISGVVGLASTTVGEPFGWLAWLATGYVTVLVELVARLPGASVEIGRVSSALVWLYYGVLVSLFAGSALDRTARRLLAGVSSAYSSSPVFKEESPGGSLPRFSP